MSAIPRRIALLQASLDQPLHRTRQEHATLPRDRPYCSSILLAKFYLSRIACCQESRQLASALADALAPTELARYPTIIPPPTRTPTLSRGNSLFILLLIQLISSRQQFLNLQILTWLLVAR